jgi:hypothetical protein
MTNFHLSLRDAEDLAIGAPDCIYRAHPQVGVFESEGKFLDFLRTYYVPRYGDCLYHGIVGVTKDLVVPTMIRQGKPMNYEVVNKNSNEPKVLTAKDLPEQVIAVIVSPESCKGQLVIKFGFGRLNNITNPGLSWGEDMTSIKVRLLAPGEEWIIRGK